MFCQTEDFFNFFVLVGTVHKFNSNSNKFNNSKSIQKLYVIEADRFQFVQALHLLHVTVTSEDSQARRTSLPDSIRNQLLIEKPI